MEGRLFPRSWMPAAHPWLSAIQCLSDQSERRRIVALIRREALKNQDFFALQDSSARCDILLTMTVDKPRKPGL